VLGTDFGQEQYQLPATSQETWRWDVGVGTWDVGRGTIAPRPPSRGRLRACRWRGRGRRR
jgi:hypothetical protein